MGSLKGLVAAVEKEYCIIVTPDGQFIKVRRPGCVELGQEIEVDAPGQRKIIRPMALVASFILIFALLFSTAVPWGSPVAAYVSLDINPSVELGVDRLLKVVEARALNQDGSRLLAGLGLKGMALSKAVRAVFEEAVRQEYIKPGDNREHVILASITVEQPGFAIDDDVITAELQRGIDEHHVPVAVFVESTSREVRAEAKKLGVSAGKLALYKKAKERGKDEETGKVKEKTVMQLLQEAGLGTGATPGKAKDQDSAKDHSPDKTGKGQEPGKDKKTDKHAAQGKEVVKDKIENAAGKGDRGQKNGNERGKLDQGVEGTKVDQKNGKGQHGFPVKKKAEAGENPAEVTATPGRDARKDVGQEQIQTMLPENDQSRFKESLDTEDGGLKESTGDLSKSGPDLFESNWGTGEENSLNAIQAAQKAIQNTKKKARTD